MLRTLLLGCALGLAASEWATLQQLQSTCAGFWPDADAGTGDPLSLCQWDMRTTHAFAAHQLQATGKGARVGVMDSGVDLTHPDLPPNFDVEGSCSFITTDTPTAHPDEMGNGDCANKPLQRRAIQDLFGYGTHAVAMVGAAKNGKGIVGVAPEATVLALKVCTQTGMCFADAAAKAIRYAGDIGLDVLVMNIYVDPYLYLCQNDAAQRAIAQEVRSAVTYARQRGVLIVSGSGGGGVVRDLSHPTTDPSSPDWPEDTSELRYVKNNCRIAPIEFPGILLVSASGPDGLISISNSGNAVSVTAPGGDFVAPFPSRFILGAFSSNSSGFWNWLTSMGLTFVDSDGARYAWTYNAAPPQVAGVAALFKQKNPKLSGEALANAVLKAATPMACPSSWPAGDVRQCHGGKGQNSFYGAGMVNALGATQEFRSAVTGDSSAAAAADPASASAASDDAACSSTVLIVLGCLLGAAVAAATVSSVGWYRAARKTVDVSLLQHSDAPWYAHTELKAVVPEGDRLPYSPLQGPLTNTPMPLP